MKTSTKRKDIFKRNVSSFAFSFFVYVAGIILNEERERERLYDREFLLYFYTGNTRGDDVKSNCISLSLMEMQLILGILSKNPSR